MRSAWLVSPRFDLAAFVLPAAGSLLLGALASRLAGPGGETPAWAWVALVLLVDVAHVHGTTLRVYLTGDELRRRPALYLGVPAAGLIAGVGLYLRSPLLFWRCLAYLAVIHFVRQQIGWLRLYRRRAGAREDRWLDEAAVYAGAGYPLLAWHARLPERFDWFVPGDFVTGLPQAVASAAFPLYLAILSAFALRQLQRALRGEPPQTGKVLLVATTAATWAAGILVWRTDFAFTATNVLAHGVPYMAVSFRVGAHQRRSFFFRAAALYAAALALLAYAEEWLWDRTVWRDHPGVFPGPDLFAQPWLALLVPLLALPQVTHYVLDAYLWRLDGTNPGLAEALGVAELPAAARS